MSQGRKLKKHRMLIALLSLYVLSLATFVFFPRPILESSDPVAISEFIKSHSNFFYKILYADAQNVATANFFMLTPFVLLARLAFPMVKLIYIALIGVGISVIIELFQMLIPGRVSDLADFSSNSISVVIGVVILHTWQIFTRKSPTDL